MSRAKLEGRSGALGSAIGHLPTRPGGRERTVPAPVSFWRFRPILGSGAQMEGRGGTDAGGAIRRIGPSQAAGVCTGDRKRVFGRRHGRWPGPRRVASNGGGFARFRRHFAPSWALKTDAKRRLGWVGGFPGPWVHLIAPGERQHGRGAPTGLLNMKKIGPRTRTLSARTCTRWGGEIRFFFASRFYLGLAVAIPDAPGSALAGCVVGVRI